jgi:hypothetical protein
MTQRDEIARVLFEQRQTPHSWDLALEADPESDAGTLLSICRDDADAVLQTLAETNWWKIDEVRPPESPVDECYFLVWGPHLPPGFAVTNEATRFHAARHPSYPDHLSSRGFTHWRFVETPEARRG